MVKALAGPAQPVDGHPRARADREDRRSPAKTFPPRSPRITPGLAERTLYDRNILNGVNTELVIITGDPTRAAGPRPLRERRQLFAIAGTGVIVPREFLCPVPGGIGMVQKPENPVREPVSPESRCQGTGRRSAVGSPGSLPGRQQGLRLPRAGTIAGARE